MQSNSEYSGISGELRPVSFLEDFDDNQEPTQQSGGGTVCERSIIKYYDSKIGRTIPAATIRDRLTNDGHAKSTIGRAITNLIKHKVLIQRADGLVYTGAALPVPKKYFSVAGDPKATNRFGLTRKLDTEAKLVQAVLIERLDEIFEQPMSGLATLCRLLIAADKLSKAVEAGHRHESLRLAELIRDLREELNGDAERRRAGLEPLMQPLGPPHVMDAIAIALFPSEYEEIPEAAKQIAESLAAKREADNAWNAEVIIENERVLAENIKIDQENKERIALGLKPLERQEVRKLMNEKEVVDGLVIPDRLGEQRMAAFLEWYKGSSH